MQTQQLSGKGPPAQMLKGLQELLGTLPFLAES
jgi:hypothetical protein